MNQQINGFQVGILIAYAVGMSAGQLLFKLASRPIGEAATTESKLAAAVFNAYFAAAVVLYLVLSLVWIWVLSFTPLSKAYPFVALAFVLTPAAAALFLGESISLRLLIGLALIGAGLLIIGS